MNNIFKDDEFESLFSKVKEEVEPILDTYQQALNNKLEVDEIIMWQRFQNGEYIVIPTEKCPEQIKKQVLAVIYKYNPKF